MPINYSYVMPRDFGFAPNPFGKYCTLATCKPRIRKKAIVGDWVFGTSSTAGARHPKLIYAMLITEKMNFNSYYNDPRFCRKKPVINGSQKRMYGDNIYHYIEVDSGEKKWIQDNSHHSYEDGETNFYNLERDTSRSEDVLISNNFYYFGGNAIEIPLEIKNDFCKKGPGHRRIKGNIAQSMITIIEEQYSTGLHGNPTFFYSSFERYNGK